MGILRADLLTHSQLEGSGSVEFDGVGDYLTFGSHSAFSPATADVTIELWVYLTDGTNLSSGNYYLCDMGSNGYRFQIYNGGFYWAVDPNDYVGPINNVLSNNTWHHIAGVRNNNSLELYVDGVHLGSKTTTASVTSTTFTIGSYSTGGGDYEPYGYISNFRYVRGVVYKNNFTPPKFELKNIPGTIVLGCQSTTSATDFAVTPSTVTANGDAAASAFHPGLKKDITDTGVVFDGFTVLATSTYMVPPGGNTRERGRGRGVLGGGAPFVSPNVLNNMSYVEVQSGGIFNDFGDLTVARGQFSAGQNASSTRGLSSGGWTSPVGVNTIDFITISNTANAIDFGDTTITRPNGVLSNQTRSLTASNGDLVDTIDFVTIATAGNASDFGNLLDARALVSGVSSPTRGVWGGGRNNTPSSNTEHNTLQYITIASTGDAQDFGDLTRTRYGMSGFSSSTRGIFAGGYSNPQGKFEGIEYFTIATLGNAIDFGDLTTTQGYGGSLTNSILGLITINNPSNYYNTIDFITISTTGNAKDFGDADPLGSGKGHGSFPSCMSDSHGGTT